MSTSRIITLYIVKWEILWGCAWSPFICVLFYWCIFMFMDIDATWISRKYNLKFNQNYLIKCEYLKLSWIQDSGVHIIFIWLLVLKCAICVNILQHCFNSVCVFKKIIVQATKSTILASVFILPFTSRLIQLKWVYREQTSIIYNVASLMGYNILFSFIDGYQHFGGTCWFLLKNTHNYLQNSVVIWFIQQTQFLLLLKPKISIQTLYVILGSTFTGEQSVNQRIHFTGHRILLHECISEFSFIVPLLHF
jgi:hypothetical protein